MANIHLFTLRDVELRLAQEWWFRNAMLFFARGFRYIYNFARSLWISPLFWLVVTISAFAIGDYLFLGTVKTWSQLLPQLWSQWWAILVVYALTLVSLVGTASSTPFSGRGV